jgi:hypothetical protein
MRSCYRCGSEIARETIGVRDACERCHAYLHCCRNCDFYEPGAHNDCREPNAGPVADKEQGNFCDFFRMTGRAGKPASAGSPGAGDARAKLDALFPKK